MLIAATVNGEAVESDVEPRRRLVDFLREGLGLVGTNVGCGHGVCGACTVLLDGQTVKSCLLFAVQIDGHELTTIESVSPAEGLNEVQAAFKRNFSIQCGYCAPGFVLAVQQLLDRYENPSDEEIAFALSGNICRCSGYVNVFKAVRELAGARVAASR
jgi:aerobic-type carbon monoxide dehydrogenase small subunit (CoxS/CutS family)